MRLSIAALATLVLVGVTVPAQSLTDQQIADAIRAGEARKFSDLVSNCAATAGFGESMAAGLAGGVQRDGSYGVTVSGNVGRIAFMAARAKRLYKKFSIDNVTEELRAPAIFVDVEPRDPSRSQQTISVAAPIEHIVLKSKVNPEAVVQPEKVDTEPVEWSNLLGGKVEANRAVAYFDYNAVKELPSGDFDVVVITPAGERRCKVGSKDRLKLFGSSR